jgi:hypothetical protein
VDYSGINQVSEPEPQTPRERLDNAILSARTGVKMLRIAAIVLAVVAVMSVYGVWQQYGENFGSESVSNWTKLAFSIQTSSFLVVSISILLASSYLLAIYAARAEVQVTTPPPASAAVPFSLNLQASPASAAPAPPLQVDPRVWQPAPPPGTDTEASWRAPSA